MHAKVPKADFMNPKICSSPTHCFGAGLTAPVARCFIAAQDVGLIFRKWYTWLLGVKQDNTPEWLKDVLAMEYF